MEPATPAAENAKSANQLQIHAESFRSVLIEMVFCPKGPDTEELLRIAGCIQQDDGTWVPGWQDLDGGLPAETPD